MSVALDSGSSFAGYQIESVVGRGGMGVVYRATDLSLERPVALKLVAPELAEDELFRRRFLKEPRLAASLDHPNVVPIYEAGEHDGQLYLAMRFVDGSDMRTLLRREGGLPAERALDILAQVAGALDAAHRRGLVHRDVKPANVLVDEDGHAYLTDFGVTKQLGGNTTETGQIVGTLDYVAPEQIRGEDVDARADGYALACVLYECLAGRPPFHRATEAETLWAHMQEPPPPLPGHPALQPVMAKALAKDPDDRYATCGELIADARAALAHPIVPPRLLRRRHAILAAGVLVLAATAVAIVLASRDGGSAALQGPVLPTGDGLAAIRADGKRIASFTGCRRGAEQHRSRRGQRLGAQHGGREGLARRSAHRQRDPQPSSPAGGRPTSRREPGRCGSAAGPAPRIACRGSIPPRERRRARCGSPAAARIGFRQRGLSHDRGRRGCRVGDQPGQHGLAPGSGERPARRRGPGAGRGGGDRGRRRGRVGDLRREHDLADRPAHEPHAQGDRARQQPPVRDRGRRRGGVGDLRGGRAVARRARAEPPIERTIEVGAGVRYVAFGDGAVWVANWNDSTVSRVDPATNQVTARVPVGAAQALAAGAGSAWVSVAGGSRSGVLPASACGELIAGGGRPDVLIASNLTLRGPSDVVTPTMVDAIRFVLQDHGFRAGEHTVGYRSCDDSTAQSGGVRVPQVRRERQRVRGGRPARRGDRPVLLVLRPDHDPDPQPGPAAGRWHWSGRRRRGRTSRAAGELALPAPYGYRGEPDVYYPTGERNFVRLSRQRRPRRAWRSRGSRNRSGCGASI